MICMCQTFEMFFAKSVFGCLFLGLAVMFCLLKCQVVAILVLELDAFISRNSNKEVLTEAVLNRIFHNC